MLGGIGLCINSVSTLGGGYVHAEKGWYKGEECYTEDVSVSKEQRKKERTQLERESSCLWSGDWSCVSRCALSEVGQRGMLTGQKMVSCMRSCMGPPSSVWVDVALAVSCVCLASIFVCLRRQPDQDRTSKIGRVNISQAHRAPRPTHSMCALGRLLSKIQINSFLMWNNRL